MEGELGIRFPCSRICGVLLEIQLVTQASSCGARGSWAIPKKDNAKECSNYCTIALISHASKVILKILQARLQQYVNRKLPDVQADFKTAEEPEIKLPTSTASSKK